MRNTDDPDEAYMSTYDRQPKTNTLFKFDEDGTGANTNANNANTVDMKTRKANRKEDSNGN